MKKSILWTMAVTAGLVVANNYYNQPLLSEFARTFSVSEESAGLVAAITQVGYAIGLLFLVPLGDKIERKKLICASLAVAAATLVMMATASSFAELIAASLVIGIASIAPQLLTPFAAHMAGGSGKGKAVGTVMFGLLCGILLSRTAAGWIGAHWGWRTVYWIAAGIMIALVLILSRQLPTDKPAFKGSYADLMRSLAQLYRDEPIVRETSTIAALQFAAFSGFWTTLSFHLHGMPAQYGSDVVGMFGLVGIVGAAVAPYAGKLNDQGNSSRTVLISSLILVFSFAVFSLGKGSLAALVVGVILLDLGMQVGHVSNMARNLGLNPTMMSRANTLYMFIRFAGGALGTVLANFAWGYSQWTGVCSTGLALSFLSIVVQYFTLKTKPSKSDS